MLGDPPQSASEGHLELLIVQATPFCNISCSYCYLSDRDDQSRMDHSVLESLFRRVFQHRGLVRSGFTVCWHAGEPLVAGIEYYSEALRRLELVRTELQLDAVRVQQSFQTNATLVNDAWCGFFKSCGARIGVSLDGPAALHDSRRVTRLGKGTHAKVMHGVELLRNHDIDIHIIAVVTRATLEDPDGFYEFFRNLGVARVGLNMEEIENHNRRSSLEGGDVTPAFRAFIRHLFKRSREDGGVHFREFDSLRSMILRPGGSAPATRGTQMTRPLSIISCDHRGNVSTFSPELLGASSAEYGGFIFGNVMEQSIGEMMQSETFRRVNREIQNGVSNCAATCEYFDLCGGGAPSNKFFELGHFEGTETLYCRHARMTMVDAALDLLEDELLSR